MSIGAGERRAKLLAMLFFQPSQKVISLQACCLVCLHAYSLSSPRRPEDSPTFRDAHLKLALHDGLMIAPLPPSPTRHLSIQLTQIEARNLRQSMMIACRVRPETSIQARALCMLLDKYRGSCASHWLRIIGQTLVHAH